MAISINKVSKNIQDKVIEEYIKGVSIRTISEIYQLNRFTVSSFLEKNNIKTTKGNHYRRYYHTENYFEKIDLEEKAYWLGFMFADGYIVDNSNRYGQDEFGISLSEKDKDHLEKFKKSIKATNPILIYKRNSKTPGEPLARILLTSQKTANDLIDKGCIKQKSLVLKPPKNVPNELIHHFLRGFFDGDGSIAKTKNESMRKTDGFLYNIRITTTYEMANWIQNIVNMGYVYKEKGMIRLIIIALEVIDRLLIFIIFYIKMLRFGWIENIIFFKNF